MHPPCTGHASDMNGSIHVRDPPNFDSGAEDREEIVPRRTDLSPRSAPSGCRTGTRKPPCLAGIEMGSSIKMTGTNAIPSHRPSTHTQTVAWSGAARPKLDGLASLESRTRLKGAQEVALAPVHRRTETRLAPSRGQFCGFRWCLAAEGARRPGCPPRASGRGDANRQRCQGRGPLPLFAGETAAKAP